MVSKNKYINEYKKKILVGGVENSVGERGEKVVHDFPSDSLFGKRTKKTRIFRLCFQTSQCPLHMDCLWIKATSLFGAAVLLTWPKGKASASGHYHYHFTLFLPACYMGFPLQIFFFFYLLRRLIHPSHAWENLNRKMHKIDEEEKAVTLDLFFAYSQTFFPFCSRQLLFLWCWLTLFIFIESWLL